jgi:hypothetical protein
MGCVPRAFNFGNAARFLCLKTDRRLRLSRLIEAASKDLLTVLVPKAEVTPLCNKELRLRDIYLMA